LPGTVTTNLKKKRNGELMRKRRKIKDLKIEETMTHDVVTGRREYINSRTAQSKRPEPKN